MYRTNRWRVPAFKWPPKKRRDGIEDMPFVRGQSATKRLSKRRKPMRIHTLFAVLAAILAPAIGLAHDTHSSRVVSTITAYRAPIAVTTGALNLREGPGTSYRAIAVLHRNTTVHVNGCSPSGHWCNVSTAMANGWVSARYLSHVQAHAPAPIPGPIYGGTWPYPYASVVPYPYMALPRTPGSATVIYSQP